MLRCCTHTRCSVSVQYACCHVQIQVCPAKSKPHAVHIHTLQRLLNRGYYDIFYVSIAPSEQTSDVQISDYVLYWAWLHDIYNTMC